MEKLKQTTGVSLKTSIFYLSILTLFFGIVITSCTTQKNSYYFKTLPGDTSISSGVSRVLELRIRKNDLLSINVSSLNPSEDMVFNAAAGGSSSATAGAGIGGSGYVVDAGGNIQMHRLGLIHAEGMTRAELKNKIQKDVEPYLKDPVVTVRFLNHRVTVLGEVGHPSVVQMPEERLSVLELLGTSGDLTDYAKKNNILVIRETTDGKQLKRISLEDHSIFTSEWYYLLPDDVVYVEPGDRKLNEEKRNRIQQSVGLLMSGISLAVIILDRIIN